MNVPLPCFSRSCFLGLFSWSKKQNKNSLKINRIITDSTIKEIRSTNLSKWQMLAIQQKEHFDGDNLGTLGYSSVEGKM